MSSFTSAVQAVVSVDQTQVDAGNAYFTSYSQPRDNLEAVLIRLKTGAKPFYFNICVFAQGLCEVKLSRDFTGGAGTQLTPSNMNMGSANTPAHEVYFNTPLTGIGTILIPSAGSTLGEGLLLDSGQSDLLSSVMIGALNTEYLLTIINRSGSTGDFGMVISGWEE
jgi:hypothetical protein